MKDLRRAWSAWMACTLIGMVLTTLSAAAANPDNVGGTAAGAARYEPGGTYTISGTYTYDTTPLSLGLTITIQNADVAWTFNSASSGGQAFSVAPAAGAAASPGAAQGTFSLANIAVPASGTEWSATFNVPADTEGPVQISVTVAGTSSAGNGGGQYAAQIAAWTVQPPVPPVFTNQNPADSSLAAAAADIANHVTAGQTISFSVNIAAAQGQTLSQTGFAVSPGEWDQQAQKWSTGDDETAYLTWNSGTADTNAEGYVDFSDTAGSYSRTVGGFTHQFDFTPIAGNQDGVRTFTWHVPAGVVTKTTPQADRVFVISIGAIQDNKGMGDVEWAVRVDPVDIPPVISNGDSIALTTPEDSTSTFYLVATDQDGDPLTWSVSTNPAHGTATFVAAPGENGSTRGNDTGNEVHIQYTPAANYFGSDSFVVTVNDGDGGTDSITVNVTVTPVNDPPEAVDDSLTVEEDSTHNTVDVLANDSSGVDTNENRDNYTIAKVNGTAISVNGNSVATAHGAVLLTTENVGNDITRQVLRYTPDADYYGLDTFTYTIDDGNGGTATATVTINVANVNDPPTANDDSFTVAEDSGATVLDVLANDTYLPDPPETLTVFSVTQPSHGAVTIGNGSADVSYTPEANFNGTDTFTYTVSDGHGGTNTATVTVTVTPVNDPPVAQAQTVFIQKGMETSKNIALGATDVDNSPSDFTFTIVSPPSRGTISNFDAGAGTLTYTVTDPNTEFYDGNPNGPQADTFTFKVSDGAADSNIATVHVTFRTNQPPTVVAVSPGNGSTPVDPDPIAEVDADGNPNSLTFTAKFTDDADPSGNGAMADIKWYLDGVLQESSPGRSPMESSASIVVDYDSIHNDASGHRPAQKVFELKAVGTDTQGGATEVVWHVTVLDVDRQPPAPAISIGPNAPTTTDDLTVSVDQAPVDPDGDAITGYTYFWTLVNGAPSRDGLDGATLSHANTKKGQTWKVTVAALTDPYGSGPVTSTNAETAEVTVGNTVPVATAQSVTTDEDTPVAIHLAGVDPDVADGVDTLTFAVAAAPSHGVLTNFDPETGTVTYTPAKDYNGSDSFTFTVTDGDAVSAPATVDITINPVNDPPVAANLTTYTPIGKSVNIMLQATDVDQGQTFTFSIISPPQHGTLTASRDSNGSALYLYTPDSEYAGPDHFTYKATDDGTPPLDSNEARVDIAVGTPPWFPILSWSNLSIVQPAQGHYTVYRLQIFGTVEPAGERQGQVRRFLDTWIVGKTSLLPTDYDAAGNPGLLPNGKPGAPADHYSWRVRAFVDGAPQGDWVDGQDFTIDDYGVPGQGQALSSGQNSETGLFWFEFDIANAAKYEIQITSDSGYCYDQVVAFHRRPDGTVEFVGPFKHKGVFLPAAGPFKWRVRGWNPLGWGAWSEQAGETGPTTGVDDATPSRPVPVGEAKTDANGNEYYQMAGISTDASGRGIAHLQWSGSHATAYRLVLREVGGRTIYRGMIGDRKSTEPMADGQYATDGVYYQGDTVAGLRPGQYVWFVLGWNANAVGTANSPWGLWSKPCYFEVLPPAGEDVHAGAVEILQAPEITDNGDGTADVTFYFAARNAASFTVRILDTNKTPRRFRVYSGIPAGPNAVQTVAGALVYPMPRPVIYQVWAVGADGTKGPVSAIQVIPPQ